MNGNGRDGHLFDVLGEGPDTAAKLSQRLSLAEGGDDSFRQRLPVVVYAGCLVVVSRVGDLSEGLFRFEAGFDGCDDSLLLFRRQLRNAGRGRDGDLAGGECVGELRHALVFDRVGRLDPEIGDLHQLRRFEAGALPQLGLLFEQRLESAGQPGTLAVREMPPMNIF
jgi:hypothetical protein